MVKFHVLHDGTRIERPTKVQRLAAAKARYFSAMAELGFSTRDAELLCGMQRTLRRWHELECGIESGGVERDETTGKVTWHDSATGKRSPYPDKETPCLERLKKLFEKYPFNLSFYVQGDPRGCALYVYRLDHPTLKVSKIDSVYSNVGIPCGYWG